MSATKEDNLLQIFNFAQNASEIRESNVLKEIESPKHPEHITFALTNKGTVHD